MEIVRFTATFLVATFKMTRVLSYEAGVKLRIGLQRGPVATRALDGAVGEDRYPVIIANNRDEWWDRPSRAVEFWSSDPNCISGLDNIPGKERGTWFGVSKTGKFASVLNILSNGNETGKRGRGFLVSDFIRAKDDGSSALNKIQTESHLYKGFNLVALNIQPGFKFVLRMLSSGHFNGDVLTLPSQGFYAFGNCRYKESWRKVEAGKRKFANAVKEYGHVSDKAILVNQIIDVLSDKTRYLPDVILECQETSFPQDLMLDMAAVNVWSPKHRCGTRTMSVILIDIDGNVDYIEKTLKEPVSVSNPEWITTTHRFQMDISSRL